jgi:hypothetical protein
MNSPPPLEFLVTSSQAGLENFELGKLNKIANLRKELREVVEEWIEADIQSRLARWILECRRAQDAAADPRASEPPALLRHAAASLLPIPGEAMSSQECQAQPVAVAPLSNLSRNDRRDSTAARRVLPLPRPALSERAQDALIFLEQQGRLQTDTIGQDVHKSAPGTDRGGTSLDCAKNAVHHQSSRRPSHTSSLFPTTLECHEGAAGAGSRSRRFAANRSAKRAAPKGRAVAGSANPTDVAHIVQLVRREELRPSAPVRASMRFLAPHRKAV